MFAAQSQQEEMWVGIVIPYFYCCTVLFPHWTMGRRERKFHRSVSPLICVTGEVGCACSLPLLSTTREIQVFYSCVGRHCLPNPHQVKRFFKPPTTNLNCITCTRPCSNRCVLSASWVLLFPDTLISGHHPSFLRMLHCSVLARVCLCVCTCVHMCVCIRRALSHTTCIPLVSRYRVQSLSDSSHHPGTEEGEESSTRVWATVDMSISTCLHRAGGAIRVSIPLDWNDKRSVKREVVSGGY